MCRSEFRGLDYFIVFFEDFHSLFLHVTCAVSININTHTIDGQHQRGEGASKSKILMESVKLEFIQIINLLWDTIWLHAQGQSFDEPAFHPGVETLIANLCSWNCHGSGVMALFRSNIMQTLSLFCL